MKATDVPLEPAHRWEWLKYQLRVRGSSLNKLADELGIGSSAVKDAKHRRYPRVERAIAQKLGLHPGAIWPERWNADGTPNRQRPNRAEKSASISTTLHLSGSNANTHRQRVVEA
ncbi:transcriptional regulator [Halomonas eurihalina]|uniref:Transcriptional regulator n=2 Tax=Halomonas eurihalina TaxID=42566 RepID=A0A5D9DCM3_HALER|nr:transcriptional regulator [Halomonas eurihalina]